MEGVEPYKTPIKHSDEVNKVDLTGCRSLPKEGARTVGQHSTSSTIRLAHSLKPQSTKEAIQTTLASALNKT